MFEMSIGIMKAESRPGPRSSRTWHCSETVCRPPMPEPMNTPISSRLTRFRSRPESRRAWPGGMDAELGKAVGAPDFLGRREGGKRVEILDLGGNLAVELRGIEAGDPGDAALAGEQVVPESVHLMTQRGNHAQAGDDYPALGPVAGHKIKRGSSS